MARKSLFAKAFSSLFLLAILPALALLASAAAASRNASFASTERALFASARAMAPVVASSTQPGELAALVLALGGKSGLRITVVDRAGRVLADSGTGAPPAENHLSRPEIAAALAGRPGSDVRLSGTLGLPYLYAAVPLPATGPEGGTAAALRLALPIEGIEEGLRPFVIQAAIAFATMAALVALASRALASRLSAPLAALSSTAAAIASGRLRERCPEGDIAEAAELARSLNAMASSLEAMVAGSRGREEEMAAVFEAMEESVLSVSPGLELRWANPGARRLFSLPEKVAGMGLLEAVGNASIHAAARRALSSGEPVEDELIVLRGGKRRYRVRAAPLADGGLVIVLEDLTRLRRLETLRSDFVANVSHELRTPITLIKGFAEAIESEGLDSPQAERHLAILARNASRLGAIVDDLLVLAGLEEGGRGIRKELLPLRPTLEAGAATAEAAYGKPDADITVDCPPGASLPMDQGLVEQAVVNLVGNALRYGKAGGRILVSARAEEGGWAVSVEDEGPGIPPDKLERLFERFYRADKGRSRASGGTGLGLAIVKHIALAHGGRVEARSELGKGSIFTMRLPSSPPEPGQGGSPERA